MRVLLYAGGGAIAVMVFVVTNAYLWSRSDQTFTEINAYATTDYAALTSATTRIELWRLAEKMFITHPFIGVGNHRFRTALIDYRAHRQTVSALESYSHPHNDFLKLAAELGLPGAISFVLLLGVPLAAAARAYRRHYPVTNPVLMLIIFCSGILMAEMVDLVLIWRPTIMFYGLVVSLLLVNMDRPATTEQT